MWSYCSNFVLLLLGIKNLVNSNNCLDVDSVVHRDKYMEHQVFTKFKSQSLYTCASECLMSSACLSLGFDKKTRTCLLNSNGSDRTGFLFSDIQHLPQSLSGQCTQRICPNNNRCEVTRLGVARCIPEFQGCGPPPDVRDAKATYDGHYQGAVATYSCNSDYRTCHSNITVICQSSGTWESLEDLCEQYRWHNPIKDRYPFPCGPPSNFKLKISVKPTKTTRLDIALHKQEDFIFYSEFRLKLWEFSKIVVVNTKIEGRWGSEVHADQTMAVEQNYDVEISLQDGVYRLVVDGASIINFTERVSGAEPEDVSFFYDVAVGMMEFMS